MSPRFGYVRPSSLAEATRLLAAPGAMVLAGGTDLLGCLRDGAIEADLLVSLAMVPGLRGIERRADGSLRIGALTTLAEIAASPEVRAGWTALAEGAASAASPQLRNQGTLGGNLCQRPRCWYFRGGFDCVRRGGSCSAAVGENELHAIFGGAGCVHVHPSDTAPTLVALDAQAVVTGPRGARTVRLEAFFVPPAQDPTRETVLEPGEILTEVILPARAGVRSTYRKVRARGAWDFALGGAAVALRRDGPTVAAARVVLSGVAPIPWRVPATEAILRGQPLDAMVIERAAAAAVEGAEPLEQNGWKVPLVRGIVAEALVRLA